MEPLQTVVSPISPLRSKSFADAGFRTCPIPQISISGRENIPPTHPNLPIDQRKSPSSSKKIPSIEAMTVRENPRSDGPGVRSPDSSVKVPLILSFSKILSLLYNIIMDKNADNRIPFHVVFLVSKNKNKNKNKNKMVMVFIHTNSPGCLRFDI